jgi:hypothetical protein
MSFVELTKKEIEFVYGGDAILTTVECVIGFVLIKEYLGLNTTNCSEYNALSHMACVYKRDNESTSGGLFYGVILPLIPKGAIATYNYITGFFARAHAE